MWRPGTAPGPSSFRARAAAAERAATRTRLTTGRASGIVRPGGLAGPWAAARGLAAPDHPAAGPAYGEEPLAVRWHRRQYRCREAAGLRRAFTESIAEVPARARLTGRLCRQLAGQVAAGRSVAAVAAEYQVSWPVAHQRYAVHADALLTEPDPPVVLGIDGTRRGTPKWIQAPVTGKWVRTERFETNFTDLSGRGRLLGQVAGRTGAAVTGWLDDRGQDWKNQVAFVAIDPSAVYRSAVERSLPHAVIVVDHFHLVRLANQAVTRVRQRVTWQSLGRRAPHGIRRGRTGGGCCAAGNDCPSRPTPGCGPRSWPRKPPDSCSPPGSPRRNSSACLAGPHRRGPVRDQQLAVRVLRLVRPVKPKSSTAYSVALINAEIAFEDKFGYLPDLACHQATNCGLGPSGGRPRRVH
jgi:hypothetical protein